jgi:hypothetical protein
MYFLRVKSVNKIGTNWRLRPTIGTSSLHAFLRDFY